MNLLRQTWWSYDPAKNTFVETGLHAFNLFEGGVWTILAGLVIARYVRHLRRSVLEVGYALAFLTFGLTDFREAYGLPTWLIGVKLMNLVVLGWLRSTVIRRFYPGRRWY